MRTVDSTGTREIINGEVYVHFDFRSLSTDGKVTEFDGCHVRNGSTEYEIDTCKLSVYDAENQTWNEVV